MRRDRIADFGSGWATRVETETRCIHNRADTGGSLERRPWVGRFVGEIEVVQGSGGALALEGGVPVVLYRVVGPARQKTGDGGPLVPKLGVGLDDRPVLLRRERPVLHLGRQLVAPPEPARLPGSTRHRFADQRPVPRPVFAHQGL